MSRTGTKVRDGIGLTLTLFACLAAGCISDDQWTFALSRSVYETPQGFDSYASSMEPTESKEGLPAALMLAFPLALDIVVLPVALTRDFFVLVLP